MPEYADETGLFVFLCMIFKTPMLEYIKFLKSILFILQEMPFGVMMCTVRFGLILLKK